MGLAARTNQSGEHYYYDSFAGHIRGRYFGGDTDDIRYNDLYAVEYNSKWSPTPGYAGCTDWFRRIQKFTVNEPAVGRRYNSAEFGLGEPSVNLTYDGHLINDFRLGGIFTLNINCSGCENSYNESITKALNDLTRHYVGIGADVAEYRQTCDMFSKIAVRAGTFLNAMRNKNFALAARSLGSFRGKPSIKSVQKDIANLWLEYSYGWKPLAQDLYEAQKLAHAALLKPIAIMARGHGKWEHGSHFDAGHGADCDTHLDQSNMTYLEANIVNPKLYMLSSAGLINPLSIAWEATPFSFVVDWFIPIGGTLQAITAGVGLESNGGWTSVQTNWHYDLHYRVEPIANPNDYNQYVSPGHLREEGFEFRRWCHAGFPPPKLYADVTPYSTPRALNALALVRQLV